MTDSGPNKLGLNHLSEELTDDQAASDENVDAFNLSLNFNLDDLLDSDIPEVDSSISSKAPPALKKTDARELSPSKGIPPFKAVAKNKLRLDDKNLPLLQKSAKRLEKHQVVESRAELSSDDHLLPSPKSKDPNATPQLQERLRVKTENAMRSDLLTNEEESATSDKSSNSETPIVFSSQNSIKPNRSRLPTIGFGSARPSSEEVEALLPKAKVPSETQPSIHANKIKLANVEIEAPLLIREGGHVAEGLHNESLEINEGSGLPLDDDPLSILPPDQDQSSKEPPPELAELFGDDFLGIFSDKVSAKTSDSEHISPSVNASKEPQKPEEDDFLGLLSGDKEAASPKDSEQINASPKPPEPPSNVISAAKSEEIEEEIEEEMVFEMASLHSHEAISPVRRTQEKKLKPQTPRHQKRRIKLVLFAIFAVLGAALIIGYKVFEQIETPSSTLVVSPPKQGIGMDWDAIKEDKRETYLTFYKTSREQLLNSDLKAEERSEIQGKILIALSLAQTRYADDFAEIHASIDSSIASISENCQNPWCHLGLWAWAGLKQDGEAQEKLAAAVKKTQELSNEKALIEASQRYHQWETTPAPHEESQSTAADIQNILNGVDENFLLARFILAQSYFKLGKFSQAREALTALPTDDTSPYSAALLLDAQISYQLGDFKDAQEKALTLIQNKDLNQSERSTALLIDIYAQASSTQWEVFSEKLMHVANEHPQNEVVNAKITDLCYSYRQIPDCIQIYQELVEKTPENVNYRREFCRSIGASTGLKEAIIENKVLATSDVKPLLECIDKGLQTAPQDKTLWLLQIAAHYATQAFEEAKNASLEFERIPKLAHIATLTQTAIELSSDEPKKVEAAKRLFKTSAQEVYDLDEALMMAHILLQWREFEATETLLTQFCRLAPQDLRIIELAFKLNIARQDLEQAQAKAKVLKGRSAFNHEALFEIAKLQLELGDSNEALLSLSTLLAQAPNNSQYLEAIALLYYEKGHYDAAKQYLDKVLLLDASNHKAHYYKGLCYYREKNYREALNGFQTAVSFNADKASYHFWVAQSLKELGENEEAYKNFSRIINTDKMASTDNDRLNSTELAQSYYSRALLSKNTRRQREAAKDFKQAIDIDKDNSEFHQAYAIFLYERGDCQNALEQLSEVERIEADEADALIYFIKGQCALKGRQHAQAIQFFEIAVEKGFAERAESGIDGYRDASQIYEQMGYLYRDRGRRSEARNALEKYLETSQLISHSVRQEIIRERDKL